MTATLILTEEQILHLFAQLEPQHKRSVLYQLAETAGARRAARMSSAETKLRQSATERGLKWDQMSEEEREAFVDDLVHEFRWQLTSAGFHRQTNLDRLVTLSGPEAI